MAQHDRKSAASIFQSLKGKLIVSCQAASGAPLDHLETLTRMATSVLAGGAGGLRAEGVERVAAFRALTDLPIVGIIKTFDAIGDVHITADFQSARLLSEANADIVALDCTRRRLLSEEPWPGLILRIHRELGRPICADIATLEDGLAAQEAGADAVATTLYGYTSETMGTRTVSWPLVQALVDKLKVPVILEGHVTQPDQVRRALDIGVHSVVVGSAITRPEAITARFVEASRR